MDSLIAWAWINSVWDWWFDGNTSAADKIALCSMFVSLAGGLFAAYLGAKYGAKAAVTFAHQQQLMDNKEKQCSSLVGAQYALYSQVNTLENVRVRMLEPFRNEQDRFVKLPTYHLPDFAYRISIADLYFIAESDKPDLLQDITISEQAYISSMDALSKFLDQQRVVFNGPETKHDDFDMTTGTGNIIVGKHEAFTLKLATDALYQMIDEAIPLLEETIQNVGIYLRSVYPKAKGITIKRKTTPTAQPGA